MHLFLEFTRSPSVGAAIIYIISRKRCRPRAFAHLLLRPAFMSVLAARAAVEGIPSDIVIITGPTILGICLNWGFMGVLAAQIYFYFLHFPDDRAAVKILVYGLAILDVAQTILITADAFHWFGYGFGDMAQLDDPFLNSWDVPLMDALISLIVQGFYCWRIFHLAKRVWVPAIILLVSVTQCVGGIWTAIRAHQLGQLHLISLDHQEVVVQTVWLVGAAIADVAIAATLALILLRTNKTTLPATRSVISRVVRITVETNALTAGVAVFSLIIFWAIPQHATLVVPPTSIIGKLYTNCLIAVFNNRATDAARRSNSNNHGMHSLAAGGGNTMQRTNQGAIDTRSMPMGGVKIHVVREMSRGTHLADSDMELNWMSDKNSNV
ncbi:hypothetical protein MKEN_01412400 [Mycena kentingensis (nom. inval.)]|nr:hypothetical protein MKEN_01412400 [Mycena kentingensis (nom. inval.)]